MTPLDWVAAAVIVGGLVFLRRYIVALGSRASAAARRRPVLWSVPLMLLGLLVAWKGPEWQLASRQALLTPKEYLELQNSYRATIVQALGGLFLLLGIYFTWRRVTATERQVEIAGEGQIKERFTRAIEQLGSEKLAVRLGGIYALERIARDSEKDHWPIMEVLTAYVRENAPITPELLMQAKRYEERAESQPTQVRPDIQAILTVIGRRRIAHEVLNGGRIDLSGTFLWGATLANADLSRVSFRGAHLEQVRMQRAKLRGADLRSTDLSYSDLTKADLAGAKARQANLREAILKEANFRGADLWRVRNVTRQQIESAITDEKTKLPD